MPVQYRGQPFQISHAGQSWSGAWRAEGGRIYVDSAYGSDSRKGGANAGRATAEKILRDLVDAKRKRP